MTIQIQYRRDDAATWTSVNPILAEGEPGYETDTGKFKVGNGVDNWSTLVYASGPAGPTGPTGATGAAGANGSNGVGVPTGGTTGQVLSKIDGTNYNTQWTTPATSVTSVNGEIGAVTLTYADVGAEAADINILKTAAIGVTVQGYDANTAKYSDSTAAFLGNLSVDGNVQIDGNLTISGTTTTVSAQNLAVSDNMIYLNNAIQATITNAVGNGTSVTYTTLVDHNYLSGMSVTVTGITPSSFNISGATITGVTANTFTVASTVTSTYTSGGTARAKSNANPDLGIAGSYNDGTYHHAGIFRDTTDDRWKVFHNYTPEPDASAYIDTSHASFELSDFQAKNIYGALIGNADTVTNGVYTTGSYADPSWITSITGSKVSGNISGNAANITGTYSGTITSSQVTTALGYTPYNATNPNGYTSNTGTVTNVTGSGVISVATGTTTPAISISQATTSTSGYLSSTDWNTFNNKQPAGSYITSGGALGTPSSGTLTNCTSLPVGGITATGTPSSTTYLRGDGTWSTIAGGGSGTVTDVAALTLGTTGTDLSSTVANGTTTPVITLNVPTASATNRGALSSTDWSTFNGKQAALVSGTNIKTVNSTSLLGSGDVAVQATLVSGTNIKTVNGTTLLGSGDISSFLAKSTSVFTTGTAATYTIPTGAEWLKVTAVGPGGNGGSSASGRATGGGGGGVAIKWLSVTPGQTLTYTVGTASGTASAVSSGTLTITTISGGSGANGTNTAYAASQTAGPAGGTATGGDINITGGKGGYSFGSSTTITTNFSGKGGDCPGFGSGGPAIAFVATAGVAGTGYGAGGGGAIGSATAASGTGGIIIFEAY